MQFVGKYCESCLSLVFYREGDKYYCVDHKTPEAIAFIPPFCYCGKRPARWQTTFDERYYCAVDVRKIFDLPLHESLEPYCKSWINKAIVADRERQPIPELARREVKQPVYGPANKVGRPKKIKDTPPVIPQPLPAPVIMRVPKVMEIRAAPTVVRRVEPRIETTITAIPEPIQKAPTPEKKISKRKLAARCQHTQCDEKATHGYYSDKIKRFCSEHGNDIHIGDMRVKYCSYPACMKLRRFALNEISYCTQHAPSNAIRVRGRKCAEEQCQAGPSYGYLADKKIVACAKHKTPEMVNLVYHCQYPECYNSPIYKNIESKKPTHCIEHKTPLMINGLQFRCSEVDCMEVAKYYQIIDKHPTYCHIHRPKDAFEWKLYTCANQSCSRNAMYVDSEIHYCYEHRPENAEIIPRPVKYADMPNIYCENPECIKLPAYGTKIANKCIDHKSPEDLRIKKYICGQCGNAAEHIIDELYLCPEHYNEFHDNSKTRCKICDPTDNTEMICKKCSKGRGQTERGIVKYLCEQFPIMPILGKSISGKDCGRAIPDMQYNINTHVIIVEIDESQHAAYQCEMARINSIVNGIGGRPVVVIRFNPDAWNGGKIPMHERLATLLKVLHDNLAPPERFYVKLIHLYYDGAEVREEDITAVVSV